MAISAFAVSCTQENLGVQEESDMKVLTVNVSENGFKAVNDNSRVTDNGYSTIFDIKDKIGLVIVDSDTKELVHKMYLEKTSSSWSGTVYYYENAEYIAYYPYDEDMEDVTSLEEIKEYFKDEKYTLDQSSKEAYRNCDLMTAYVSHEEISSTMSLDLNFSHVNSMVEFNIPYYSYTTSNGYSYSVPVSVDLSMGTEEDFKPYQMAVGKYRYIVPAGDTKSFKGYFRDAKTNKPVYFNANNVKLEANNANIYNINYTDGPTGSNAKREIQPGDYYYADGNIVPNDFMNVPAEGCIGVVFSDETLEEKAKDGSTCKNGYVMALIDATGNSDKSGNSNSWTYNWGYSNTTIANLYTTDNSEDKTKVTSAITDNTKSGLYNTSLIVSSGNYSSNNNYIQHAVTTFGTDGYYTSIYAASNKTTGWFIPTVAQFVSIIKALGSKDGNFSYDGIKYEVTAYDGTDKIWFDDVVEKIDSKLSKVGGRFEQHKSYMTVSMVNFYVESSTTYSNVPLYLNHSSSNSKADFNPVLLTDGGSETKRNVRLILAF